MLVDKHVFKSLCLHLIVLSEIQLFQSNSKVEMLSRLLTNIKSCKLCKTSIWIFDKHEMD